MDKMTVKDNDAYTARAPRGARFSTATYPLNPAAKEAAEEDKGGWYNKDLQR